MPQPPLPTRLLGSPLSGGAHSPAPHTQVRGPASRTRPVSRARIARQVLSPHAGCLARAAGGRPSPAGVRLRLSSPRRLGAGGVSGSWLLLGRRRHGPTAPGRDCSPEERRATCRLSADPDARGEQGAPQEGLSVPCARCTHTCVVKASGHSREESGSLRPLPCCPSSAGRPMGAPRSAPALGPRPSVAPRRCPLPLLLVLLCGLCGPPRAQSAGTAGTTPQPTAWASGSTGGLRWLRGAAGARAGVRQEGTVRFEVADSFYRAHSKVIRCEPRPPLPEPRPRCAPARRRC